ncbi:caspase family protein [Streptomyces niveus]|uniref:caspase family protein n=1 Tax=Streptomyces niveus TaxID=193462 RepID=UPI00342AB85F
MSEPHRPAPRRYVIAAGTRQYTQLPELPEAHSDVQRIADLFTSMGYERVLTEVSHDPRADDFEDALADWCDGAELTADDTVVLYYAGHGDLPDAGNYRLACAGTVENKPRSWLAPHNLEATLGASPVRNVLFVIDACNAAAGAGDIASAAASFAAVRPRGAGGGAGTWVMASARHRDLADDGAFAAELVSVCAVGDGASQRFLSPALLADRINRSFERAGRRQRASCSLADQTAQPPFFPNPAFDPSAETDADGRLGGDVSDRASHFEPRGRGVEHVSDPGSYFTGRGHALAALRTHLAATDERRPLVVTGAPGSGKSAVLGKIVLEGEGDDTSRIDVSINMRHQTLHDVVERLASAADVTATTVPTLLTALAGRRRPFRIVADSLDEAGPGDGKAEARNIAWELLRPLAAVPCVRLVIGSRRELLLHIGDRAPVIDLDSTEYADDTSIAEYAERVLTDAGSPYEKAPEVARTVAVEVAARAGQCFLVARMTTTALMRDTPIDITVPGWAERLPSDVSGALDAYLERLPRGRKPTALALLTALAFGEGHGLPRAGVWAQVASRLSGEALTEAHIDELLDEDGSYLTVVEQDGRKYFRLYHQELTAHLQTRTLRFRDLADIQQCFVDTLLDLVPIRAEEPCWDRAHPYVRGHLATHAAAAGTIDDLIEDPAFVLAADVSGLLPAVRYARHGSVPALVIERCSDLLRTGAELDRAAQLAFIAETYGAREFALRAAALSASVDRLWVEPRRVTPHRIIGQHGSGDNSTTSLSGGWVIEEVGTSRGRRVVLAAPPSAAYVYVWGLDDPSQSAMLPHPSPVQGLAVLGTCGDEPLTVTLDKGGSLRVWDVEHQTLKAHTYTDGLDRLLGSGFLSDGTPVVLCRGPHRVEVYDPLRSLPLSVMPIGLPRRESPSTESTRNYWTTADVVHDVNGSAWALILDAVAGKVTLYPLESDARPRTLLQLLRSPTLTATTRLRDGSTTAAIHHGRRNSTLTLIDVFSGRTTSHALPGYGWAKGRFVGDDPKNCVLVAAREQYVHVVPLSAQTKRSTQVNGDLFAFAVAPRLNGGRLLAVAAGMTGGVRVVDTGTGDVIGRSLRGHESAVCAVRILKSSASGTLDILSIGNDGTARVWHWNAGHTSQDMPPDEGVSEFAVSHTELVLGWEGSPTRVVASSWAGIRLICNGNLDRLTNNAAPELAHELPDTTGADFERCAEDPDGTLNLLARQERFEKADSAGRSLVVLSWQQLSPTGTVSTVDLSKPHQVWRRAKCHVLPPTAAHPHTRVLGFDPVRGEVSLSTSPRQHVVLPQLLWPLRSDSRNAEFCSAAFELPTGEVVLMACHSGESQPSHGHLWDVDAARPLRADPVELISGVVAMVPQHGTTGTGYVAMAAETGEAAVLDLFNWQIHKVSPPRPEDNLARQAYRSLASGASWYLRWAEGPDSQPLLLYMDGQGLDDTTLVPVTVWDSAHPDTTTLLPMPAARLLWAGTAPNGEPMVAVSDEHGVALCRLPSGEKVWSVPIPALVTSLAVLPEFDLAISTQQGVVLVRPSAELRSKAG